MMLFFNLKSQENSLIAVKYDLSSFTESFVWKRVYRAHDIFIT